MDKPKDPDSPGSPGGKDSDDYVSPRLRNKLSAAEDLDFEESEKDTKSQNMMALGMLAILLIVGGFLGYSMLNGKKAEEAPEPPAAAEAPADTMADSTAMAADTMATPPPAPKPPAPKPAETVQKEPEAPPVPFGIAVGSYIDQARANEELTKLQGSTGLTGKVQPFDDGGITSYRVVLGSFTSRGAADAKANDLISSDVVYEARVIALK